MFVAGDPTAPGLHRITETLHPGEYLNNRNHKDGACYKTGPERDLYLDTGLPRPPIPSIEQCDEYPFASTLEGAAHPHWDFSVMAVPVSDNASGGGQLVTFYHEDRVLAWDFDLPESINDEFWVEIAAPCGGCGGGGGGPVPPGNVAPRVDAGPDASGPEGSGIALNGTVTDPDDTPEITWSYRLGENTDPGMACQFSSPGQMRTTIRCTDDGTVTVTLAADDHHRDGPVTDTATVTVTNTAPAVKIDSPQPGQLFNGREPTPVTAGFTDRGANDSHTCEISFGDGSPPVRGTVQEQGGTGTCTGSHTYGYDGLGPRTIQVTVTDDDGGATSQSVPVVIYVPGSGYGAHVSGLITVPRSPNVHCPPSDTQSTATLSTLVGTIEALTVACHLDTQQGRTTVNTTVAGASLLGGAVRITDIESSCTAGADGITRASRVGTINGVPIGSGRGSLSVPG
ncbi:NucA/NucB deoxyribonuclease domain-containing protein [Actinokineospora soli]|uniref:NucA/NucB deoxyribonuclease domain-containing protein n=1 Tax=Actinokineospora soli TaxID=1048753 RepID=A0ABW2TNI6_9PSEU